MSDRVITVPTVTSTATVTGSRADCLFVLFFIYKHDLVSEVMTEIFSTLFGQTDAQPSTGPAGLGFAAGKPPSTMPSNQAPVAAQIPGQHGDEGPTLRKPGAMNEPFYLLRELPGKYVGSA